MSEHIINYYSTDELPKGNHRIALPNIVGWRLFGDISVAVEHMNRDFGLLGNMEYALSDEQSPDENGLPLIASGLVRVDVVDGIIEASEDSTERLTLRKILLHEIEEINFIRVREQQLLELTTPEGRHNYSTFAWQSIKYADLARQRMLEAVVLPTHIEN